MATFLFDQTIFGPLVSRRLGISLGINLLPTDTKLCSFDCIYCECGWNPDRKLHPVVLPGRAEVKSLLRQKLLAMGQAAGLPDVITFAGNGEPTMHPEFEAIIEDTILLRNELSPKSKIAVLSNATMLHKPGVVAALRKIEDNIQKLDSGIPETLALINQPVGRFDLERLVSNLQQFQGELIIQTMFLKGRYLNHSFDNTTEREISQWIALLKKIKPKMVMIYSLARDTPAEGLIGMDLELLQAIGQRVKDETSLDVQVSG